MRDELQSTKNIQEEEKSCMFFLLRKIWATYWSKLLLHVLKNVSLRTSFSIHSEMFSVGFRSDVYISLHSSGGRLAGFFMTTQQHKESFFASTTLFSLTLTFFLGSVQCLSNWFKPWLQWLHLSDPFTSMNRKKTWKPKRWTKNQKKAKKQCKYIDFRGRNWNIHLYSEGTFMELWLKYCRELVPSVKNFSWYFKERTLKQLFKALKFHCICIKAFT